MSEKTWFDLLYDEFHKRGDAMFAFSREQVEDEGVNWDDFNSKNWFTWGAGLHVKRTALVEFSHRFKTDHAAYLASLKELRVKRVGTDYWDRYVYEVVDASVEGKGVRRGQMLCDVSLSPPNEATELHTMTSEGEPIDSLKVRPVFVLEDGTERRSD